MRAWRAHQFGPYRDVLSLDQVDDPSPPADGVVVDVAAASLNFPDLLAIAGRYQVKAPLPFVPGIECAGTVAAAGARSRYQPGDRVIATALWGCFAEKLAVPDVAVFAIPDEMPFDEAASLLVTYQTGHLALVHRAHLAAGETLLVHGGAGGVGVAAIQLGKALGATVIATAGTAEKLEVCRAAGADHAINYRDDDFVAGVGELTGGRGADVVYDPVGGDVFDKSLKCTAWEGRLLVIGFASGRIPELKINRVLLKNLSVVGVYWGAYLLREPARAHAAHDALIELYRAGTLRPTVWRTLPLAELPDALAALESRASHGKIVVRP
jgi:NADPH:quinone reductase